MSLAEATAAHYRRQQRLSHAFARRAAAAWRRLDPEHLASSWRVMLPELLLVLTATQLAAAEDADAYVTATLAAQGIDPAAEGSVAAAAFSGVASDGRPLDTLLQQPMTATLTAIKHGTPPPKAIALGGELLDTIARAQVADAGRVPVGVAINARRHVGGYVRMLSGASCSRCIVLAGRWYARSQGFQRHPRCDCRHIPAREDAAGDLATDPMATFRAMTRTEQDKVFTAAGAQAIRDGADLGRVVNARRKAAGLAPASGRLTSAEITALRGGRTRGRLEPRLIGGQPVFTTAEGTGRRGRPVRLMPESIYQIATDRADLLRLLRVHGYLH